MSFSTEDILGEFVEAAAYGPGYARGAGLRLMRGQRREGIDLEGAIRGKRSYLRVKADPARWFLLLARKAEWLRAWRRRNPGRTSARRRARYQADAAYRERQLQYNREWHHQAMLDPAKRAANAQRMRDFRARQKAGGGT